MRLIDADVLLEKIKTSIFYKFYSALVALIQEAPTVDAVPVTRAHWFVPRDCKHDDIFCCSNCHHVRTGYPSRYCPHCGARMDSEVSHGQID